MNPHTRVGDHESRGSGRGLDHRFAERRRRVEGAGGTAAPRYDGSDRVELHLGEDAVGNLYLMNERNGVIYRARLCESP